MKNRILSRHASLIHGNLTDDFQQTHVTLGAFLPLFFFEVLDHNFTERVRADHSERKSKRRRLQELTILAAAIIDDRTAETTSFHLACLRHSRWALSFAVSNHAFSWISSNVGRSSGFFFKTLSTSSLAAPSGKWSGNLTGSLQIAV